MTDQAGHFVWYELMTTDREAARAFYGAVTGWSFLPHGEDYDLLMQGEAATGGLMALPPEARAAGAPPAWFGYLAVADVDAAARRLAEAGGSIHKPPGDIPGIGRFAVAADPQGAAFMLFTPGPGAADMPPPAGIGWHELHATDGAAAFDFYAGQFGWEKTEAMDMGPMGVYQLFAMRAGEPATGGMMTSPKMPRPAWIFYFKVDAIEAARERVLAAGGQVMQGPMEVPGGMWILQGMDPQGAIFALLGPKG